MATNQKKKTDSSFLGMTSHSLSRFKLVTGFWILDFGFRNLQSAIRNPQSAIPLQSPISNL